MRLFFARHGESEANVQQVFWNQPHGYGLTERGRAQAEELARTLAGTTFAALYCSPVLRAVQTAEIVGRRMGLRPEVADGLREWHTGILEGRRADKETEALYWWVTEQWMVHGNYDARIEGADGDRAGESYNDIKARFTSLIARLEALYRRTDANLLLISHGGTLRAMLPLLTSNLDNASIAHMPFTYATPIVVSEGQRDGEWVCSRWGEDVLHDG